jgi:hypothetical protein
MVGFLRKVALLLDEEISISGYITTGKSLFSTVNLIMKDIVDTKMHTQFQITKSSVTLLICFIQMR